MTPSRRGPWVAGVLVLAGVATTGCTQVTAAVLLDDAKGNRVRFDERRLSAEEFQEQADAAGGVVIYCEPTGALGIDWGRQEYHQAAMDAGLTRPMVSYDWSQGWRGFFVIPDVNVPELHRERGRRLARWITEYLHEHPDHTVDIVAMSGGCYVAVCALEELPRDVSVKRCILVTGTFSPGYDLSCALERVGERMYVYCSPGDWFILGVATCIFGCNDGVHGFAVGNRGPVLRDNPDYREKLVVRRYTWRWLKYGYIGEHMTARSRSFLANEVLPALQP
jgi:hypothetical protein